MNYLKLNMHFSLCASNAGGPLQCENDIYMNTIFIILSAEEYLWVQYIFKDLLELAGSESLAAVEERLWLCLVVIYSRSYVLQFMLLEIVPVFFYTVEILFWRLPLLLYHRIGPIARTTICTSELKIAYFFCLTLYLRKCFF